MVSKAETGNSSNPSGRKRGDKPSAARHAMANPNISSSDASLMARAILNPNAYYGEQSAIDSSTSEVKTAEVTIYSSTILDDKMTDKGRDLFTLREDKFFSSYKDISEDQLHTARIIKKLPPQERTKVLATLNSVRNILEVESLNDVQGLLDDQEAIEKKSKRARNLLAVMYGIEGSDAVIEGKVEEYGETANDVITAIRKDQLSAHSDGIEMINDVKSTNDPVQLLLMTFDRSYDPIIRFEAKRKIILMFLAANIDQREQEISVSRKQRSFDQFLTEHIFNQGSERAQVSKIHFLSTFNPEEYKCESVQVLTAENEVDPVAKTYKDIETGIRISVDENQKLTGATRRSFTYKGEEIPIQIKNPPKESVKKILKLIRKGVSNPAIAVDDDVRMMGVLDNYNDIHKFIAHMQNSAIRAGTFMDLEGMEDTINGNKRIAPSNGNATQNGGSEKVQFVKFHARFGIPGGQSKYIEVILHTNQTFMNYEYQDEVAHREFATKRFFGEDDELAAADLLFPKVHYGIEMKLARELKLAEIRKDKRRESAGFKKS